ncbi:unnamed protein product, partial [Closterium sp. NIES-53]
MDLLVSPILLTPITARRFNDRGVSLRATGVTATVAVVAWWMALLMTATVLPTARSLTAPQDLAALVEVWRGVYSSSGGSAGVRAWHPSMDPCSELAPFPLHCMPTVSAQADQRIVSLTLAGQALRGTLSAAVGNLSNLADFTLNDTRVGGTLPQFRSSTLVDLSILNSPVGGPIPSLLATAPTLTSLAISGTRVNGSIPEELVSATSTLQSLNLSSNSLAGSLPSSLSGLTSLTTLDLAGNTLSGPLPSQLIRSGLSLRLSPGNTDLCIPPAAATPTAPTLLPNTSICPASPPPAAAAPLPPPASNLPPAAVAVIAAGGAALVAVLLGAVLWRVVGWGEGKRKGEEGLIEGAEAVPRAREVADGLTEFQLWELQEATENFHFSRLIGRGGFGHVYRGTLSDGYEVAVKMLVATPGGGQGEAEYRIEIEVIGHVHHRNLVQLVGFCCEGDSRLLAYEFVSGGSLSSRLREKTNPMTWEHRVRVAVGSAKGLAYLHEQCEPRIIHRDVKPANILLDATGEAKIADFGLAKVMPQGVNDMTTRVLGTWGYVAPEYVGSERVGVAADVFSFGVVLLELLSGQSPHNTEDLLERAEACLSEGALDTFADPALLASGLDEQQFLRVLRIALLCLEYNPDQRPPMASVVRFLTSLHAPLPDENSPLEPILEGLGDGPGGGGGGGGGYSESSDTSGGLEDGCMVEGLGEGGSWLIGGGGGGKEKGDGEDEFALGDGGGGAMGDDVEVVVDDIDDGHEGDARGSHVEGQGTLALNMVPYHQPFDISRIDFSLPISCPNPLTVDAVARSLGCTLPPIRSTLHPAAPSRSLLHSHVASRHFTHHPHRRHQQHQPAESATAAGMRGRSLAYLRASLNRKRGGASAISSISSRAASSAVDRAPANALAASAASVASSDAIFDPITPSPAAIHPPATSAAAAATAAASHVPSVAAVARSLLLPALSPAPSPREAAPLAASQLGARYSHSMIRRESVSSCTPYSALRLRSPFHSLAAGGICSSISAGDGSISSDSSSNDSTASSSTGNSSGGSSSCGSSGYIPLEDSAGAEGEGTAQVVAEALDPPAAAEGSLGEEFSARAEGTGNAQVPAEGGEGGTVEAGGGSSGGGGTNAEMPGLQTPLEQLWQHIKELPDSNHAMPVVRAWESNGNTVDMRLATQLIKKLKNHRRPKQAAEVAEWFVQQPGFPKLEADYQLALSAVIRARNVAAAQALFLSFPQPFRTEKVYQPVFGHVARRGRFMSVESQVDWLRQQGVQEGIPSFNARLQALLAGRRRAGVVVGIGAIVDEMRSKGFTPITITFNIILAGLGRAGQLKEMEHYLGQMENYNLTPDLATMNALISAYVTHGEPEKALEWERSLKTSGAGPDRGTYAAMLKAYGQSRQVDKLEATWSELLASNVPMTRMLHKARIEGYGLAGDVSKAEQ